MKFAPLPFAALLAVLLSCTGDSPTETAPTAAQVQAAAGGGQTGVTETPLESALVARVTDRKGRPVPGVTVAWSIPPGAGTLAATSTPTDSAGAARTQWTLGSEAGTFTVTATAAGVPSATFTATATPPPAPERVEKGRGDGQKGAAGDALRDSLEVRVLSGDGRPVRGVMVTWSVLGGELSSSSSPTDWKGVSRVAWTLGTTAGAQGVEARVAGLAGSPVTFRATAGAGNVAKLTKPADGNGDGQTGTAGLDLAASLVVEVKDRFGNPVSGARVTWATPDSGQLSPSSVTSSPGGYAAATWKLGPRVGRQTATAAVGDLTVEFTATAVPFAPVASVSFHSPEGTMGEGRVFGLSVILRDAQGNTLTGRTVAWSSSAPSVASVSSSGIVTPLAVGRAVITATSEGKSADYVLTVVTSPKLKGFSRTPATVDVTAAAAPVEFTFVVTDAGPGVASLSVDLDSPTRSPAGCRSTIPVSGSPTDGVWKCTVTIPQGARAGTWFISQVTLIDRARTQVHVNSQLLEAAGFPSTLTVNNSGPPATLPAVTGLTISPATVALVGSEGRVDFTVSVVASAGVKYVYVATQGGSYSLPGCSFTLVGGTAANGTWKCSLPVPADAPAGTYQLTFSIQDNAGNTRYVSSTDLRDAGLPGTFTVTRP